MKLLASLLFAGTLSHIGALYLGLHIGEARAMAEAEKPVLLTKACPAPERNTKWACDAAERRDYQNICINRIAQTWRGK